MLPTLLKQPILLLTSLPIHQLCLRHTCTPQHWQPGQQGEHFPHIPSFIHKASDMPLMAIQTGSGNKSVAFSADGMRIISGSEDNSVPCMGVGCCHAPFRTLCPTPDSSLNSFPAPLHTPAPQLRTPILWTPSRLRVCLQNSLSPSPLSLLIRYTFPYHFTAFLGLISTPYLTILFHISSYAPLLVHMLPLAT